MPVVPAMAPARVVGPVASLIETTKPGITRLVTMTSMVGFVMSAASHTWSLGQLAQAAVLTAVGTALSAAGANSINQFMERDRDARMPRTARRPLPQGRVTPGTVLGAGVGLSMAGVGVLLFLGVVPALVSLACVLSYVLMYTPLKTRTALATFVGAIPGALPPLIGWSAGAQSQGFEVLRDHGGLALFALMFIWQIPHFLAIAWMYQDDYAKGGYIVLPLIDPGGWVTASTIGLWTAALLPATLLPAWVMPGTLGAAYMTVATISGTVFAILALRLIRTRGRPEARQLFFGSIMHLPLLLVTMVGEATVRSVL
jgi:protoheme IX farnesyltransferase